MDGFNYWYVAAAEEVSRHHGAVAGNIVQGSKAAAAASDHTGNPSVLSSAGQAARLLRGQSMMGMTTGLNDARHLEDPWSVPSLGSLPFLLMIDTTTTSSAVSAGRELKPGAPTWNRGVDACVDSDDEDDFHSFMTDRAGIMTSSSRCSLVTPSSSPTHHSRQEARAPNAPRRPRPAITILHSSDLLGLDGAALH
jgi:hypothetical protein